MAIHVNAVFTVGFAAVLYWLGNWLVKRIAFLRTYCIPAPLVGGLLFALANTMLYATGSPYFTFDSNIQTFLMVAFFTTVGFTARIDQLMKGGKAVVIAMILASVLTLMQNFLGAGVLMAFGQDPRLGLAVGSISLVGGPGTAASFGPVLEAAGAAGGSVVGIAAATFGLVMGSLLGGPAADWLIKRYAIAGRTTEEDVQATVTEQKAKLSAGKIVLALVLVGLCMAVADGMAETFTKHVGVSLPWFVAAMLTGAILRNCWVFKGFPDEEADRIGGICLCGFLSMAMMSLKIWDLAELAGPLVVALALQTILLLAFSYFFVFPRMGRDYDAAVMTAGFIGFAMGATSNAMANMQAVTKKYGPSPTSFLVIPLVGGMGIDFVNIFVVSALIPVLGGLV